MKRIAIASAATLLALVLSAPAAVAQSQPKQTTPAKPATQAPAEKAAPTTAAPAAPAKFVKPIKGLATIEVLTGKPKKVGTDIVTLIKVKNTSEGAIALMQIDEYWYDKNQKIVTGDTEKWRKPFNPGEIIEITMKSPWKEGAYTNNYMFSHVNGQIKAKPVKSFDEPKKK